MATNALNSNPSAEAALSADAPKLNAQQGWELIDQLAGSARGQFDEFGGVEAWLRYLREGDREHSSR